MTAFVLGATGFVGREVVRQLVVRGAPVIAHVRPDSRDLERWRTHFTEVGAAVDTTPWDATALADRFQAAGATQIYILIGTTRAKAKSEAIAGNIYETVDYGLTALAATAAARTDLRPKLVYLSSVGADPKARSQYLAWRGKAESAVVESGLPYVIARPSVITGERDEARPAEHAAAVIADGVLGLAGLLGARTLRARYRSTSPDILASALIRFAEDPAATARIVDGADLR